MFIPTDEPPVPPRKIVEQALSEGGFTVLWEIHGDWRACFTVHEVIGITTDGQKVYSVGGCRDFDYGTYARADVYIEGHIDWNVCSDIHLIDRHFCGLESFTQHCGLIKYLYTRAFELMGRKPDEPWSDHA